MSNIHKDNNGVTVIHTSKGNPGHSYTIGVEFEMESGKELYFDVLSDIEFQMGAVKENGLNGITSEALLAILIHRTRVLNNRFSCIENEKAIASLEDALHHFESRTRNRISRGVEGKELK